ncbi:MAG: excalibur calcium-binding domain-containing protein [Pegethrix bostrychoides GSE-TBD4-15B]|uniref:Excalibur calcium-binding domain-containing protein n=1 Tax=Pegethrix bostrychoides GSE-TBD4-15B TaxID=2839662 RepID=A0A951P8S4_9CYAN|nr:excalibur calcium-binding domain-containing protein [Pegethrix bostrychoides GSE-TBD4-15B]
MKLFLGGLLLIASALAIPAPQPAAAQENCEPSYPTLCIPVGSADLDCKDVDQTNFPVRQPDPHRFDGDKDGVGCEA